MPFIVRIVDPVCLSRKRVENRDGVLENVSNNTLCQALRQLASLVNLANDVFGEIYKEFENVNVKSVALKKRIDLLDTLVREYNPKNVPVPEGDLETFSETHKKVYFRSSRLLPEEKNGVSKLQLFTAESRPTAVQELYSSACAPIILPEDWLNSFDFEEEDQEFRETVRGASRLLRRKKNLDIEVRRPASFHQLREWQSDDEVFSTVTPDGQLNKKIVPAQSCDTILHRLPSPEQRARAAARAFADETVRLDITGKNFDRMAAHRRSLSHVEYDADAETATRRRKKRKDKTRRNTIAGDGTGEITQAVHSPVDEKEDTRPVILRNTPLRASITARIKERLGLKKPSRPEPKSKPLSLSQNYLADTSLTDDTDTTLNTDRISHASESDINLECHFQRALSADGRLDSIRRRLGPLQTFVTDQKDDPSDKPMSDSLYEMIGEREFGTLGASLRRMPKRPKVAHIPGVRLRELAKEEGCRSSSGNWSGSTSTRASLDSASISPAPRFPKRSTSSTSVDCDSLLSSSSRSTCPNTSGSKLEPRLVQAVPPHLRSQSNWTGPNLDTSVSSRASEGTVTPEIRDDTSSVYSCDAEGYYTSFQFDSGLRGLGAETEYDLFGQGSTSTTTSSVGTVIAREPPVKEAPAPPPRNSTLRNRDSIITVIDLSMQEQVEMTLHKEQKSVFADTVDYSKSPEPIDFSSESESERVFKFQEKTCMRSSRIPSMCAITPPGSDDESEKTEEKLEPCIIENSLKRQEKLESQIQAVFLQHFDSPDSPPSVKLPKLQDFNESSTVLTKAIVESVSETVAVQNVEHRTNADLLSLSDLPSIIPATPFTAENDSSSSRSSSLERKRGARVTLDAEGRVVYSSDSLKRRKGAKTTFEPGTCVKEQSAAKARTVAVVHMMDSVGQGNTPPVVQILENVGERRSSSPVVNADSAVSQRRSMSPAKVAVKDRRSKSPNRTDSSTKFSNSNNPPRAVLEGISVRSESDLKVQNPARAIREGSAVRSDSELRSVALVQNASSASPQLLSPSSYKENVSLASNFRLRTNSYLHANGEVATRSSNVHRADSYKQANNYLSVAPPEPTQQTATAMPSVNSDGTTTVENGHTRLPLTARTMNESTLKRLERMNGASETKGVKTVSANPNVTGRRSYGPQVMVDKKHIQGVRASPVMKTNLVPVDNLFRPIRPPLFSTEKPSCLSSEADDAAVFSRRDTKYHSLPTRTHREPKTSTPVFVPQSHSSPRRVHFADDTNLFSPVGLRSLPPYTPPPAYNGPGSPPSLNKNASPFSSRRVTASPSPSTASSCSLDMSFASSEGYDRPDLNQLDGSSFVNTRARGYGDSSGSGNTSPSNSYSSVGRSRSSTPNGRSSTSPVSPTNQTPLDEFKRMISVQNQRKPKVSAAELLGVGMPTKKVTAVPKPVETKRQYGRLSPWKGGRRGVSRGDVSIPTIPEGNSEEESEVSVSSSKDLSVKGGTVTSPVKSDQRSPSDSVPRQMYHSRSFKSAPIHPPMETAL